MPFPCELGRQTVEDQHHDREGARKPLVGLTGQGRKQQELHGLPHVGQDYMYDAAGENDPRVRSIGGKAVLLEVRLDAVVGDPGEVGWGAGKYRDPRQLPHE